MHSNTHDVIPLVPGAVDVRRLLAEAAPVEWVVEDLLPAAASIIVAAAAKTGKTYAAMRLCMAVARGEEFLGKRTERRHVRYVFLEDGRARVARRFTELGLTASDDVEFLAVFGPDSIRAVLDEIEHSTVPLLVVFDPLVVLERHLQVKDENVAMEIDRMFEPIRRSVQASGSTVVIIHHFRKAGDTMRGSVALEGSSDGWWHLNRKRGSRVVRVSCVLRDGEDTEIAYEMVKDGGAVTFAHRTLNNELDGSRESNVLRERLLALLHAKHPTTLSQAEIAAELSTSRSLLQPVLKELEQGGEVTRPNGPKGGYTAAAAPPLEVEEDAFV